MKQTHFEGHMMALFFIIAGVLGRLLPHPPNVTPIAAIALFGGTYFDRRLVFMVLLTVMLVSDFFLGFHEVMIYVYGSFLITSILGVWLKSHKRPQYILGVSLTSSLLFYLITNFGVWVETSMYPKTLTGLVESYLMGLPFFRNTILGDLFYTLVFFGGYELIKFKVQSLKFKVAIQNQNF